MEKLFLGYEKCLTCKRAKDWLIKHQIVFEERDIKENPPTQEEIIRWKERSGHSYSRFFNTSGILYREMNLSEKIKIMTEKEVVKCLASDGMLVKRPLLIGEDFVLIGFKEKEWEEKLLS